MQDGNSRRMRKDRGLTRDGSPPACLKTGSRLRAVAPTLSRKSKRWPLNNAGRNFAPESKVFNGSDIARPSIVITLLLRTSCLHPAPAAVGRHCVYQSADHAD